MSQTSRVDETVSEIVGRIVGGEFAPGDRLPGQDELATMLGVSRLTVREAVKHLQSGHILRVEHGNGTYVNPQSSWTDLAALARAERPGSEGRTARSLLEVRRVIEVGAAELAATRRTQADLDHLERHVERLAEATEADDLEGFVTHDLAFHARILRACANPFLAAVYEPLGQALISARRQTSEVPMIRRHALDHHRRILSALRQGDPGAAARAMSAHMDQTTEDLQHHVLDTPR